MKTEHSLENISALEKGSKTIWLLLLSYIVFSIVTLFGIDDADFFVSSKETSLPLIGVSVPTEQFFWFGPAILAVLHGYLHLYLMKFWYAQGNAKLRIRGDKLSERIFP
ncbi:hypothetical protein [Litoreibacter roseus]|uniref:hypothetical protein n=1 Tax=Litoreibacter roseus TaxID=2601869 RepID=UPI00135BB42D|nr:hypothetical protein [Litoreibacter roseus]